MVYSILAMLPFVTALLLMVIFRFSSGKALMISLVMTVLLVLGVWQMDLIHVAGYFLYGLLIQQGKQRAENQGGN